MGHGYGVYHHVLFFDLQLLPGGLPETLPQEEIHLLDLSLVSSQLRPVYRHYQHCRG